MEWATNLEDNFMKLSLNKVLLLNFILIILISLISTGLISSYMIDNKFDIYLQNEHREKLQNIQNMINSAIKKDRKTPDFEGEGLSKYAVLEGYFIKIVDEKGTVIYNTGKSHLIHKQMMNSKSHMMMGPMMGKKFKESIENYQEDIYTIDVEGNIYGKVTIGYLGPANISQEAVAFKSTLYKSILFSSIISIVIGLLISLIFSRQLGIPIKAITKTSESITQGNLSTRTNIKTYIKEISDLSTSVDYLASSLEEQEQLRKRLASDMAHEIRTPITTIKSHIEAFLDGIWSPTKERIKICYDEISRMSVLVEKIEDINTLKKSNYILNKSKFNMEYELKRIIDSIIPQFDKKNLNLNFISTANIEVSMDKDKFRQIMYNLLSNAYKYSLEDGKVNLSCSIERENLIIKVQDFGVGISPKDLPHIFKYLYRGDKSRNRSTGGSGIGLTITKTLVELHDGIINVSSNQSDGTIFEVSFPLSSIRA